MHISKNLQNSGICPWGAVCSSRYVNILNRPSVRVGKKVLLFQMWITCRLWNTFSLLFFSIPLLLSFFLLNLSLFLPLFSFFLSFLFSSIAANLSKQAVVCAAWKLISYHWAVCFRISRKTEEVLFVHCNLSMKNCPEV